MAQATLSIRVGKEDKQLFERFCDQTGMNATTAINMYIKNVIQNQRLPFSVEVKDHFYSAENTTHLKASIDRLETSGGTPHDLIEAE